ncbi:helix-turn-helix domain-containing protein [Pelomonas sp. KK5]|uniref:helix-turn-helix domain-containing protein n=1 Tax=Pelomonas sp. KK5 TaxID=1855730 RepID=UPI00097C6860|nr:helix-turn-helix domain-containing protein [Pelomonas sp. KK5]
MTPATASNNLLRINSPADLGPVIRARRREQSLRIDDAASLSGVSVDLLSRLENGKGSVRVDKLLTVLDSLGLALMLGPKSHPMMQAARQPGGEPPEQP